jgi:protein-S-isoprenylcysteine O-methyltransferase Ste14
MSSGGSGAGRSGRPPVLSWLLVAAQFCLIALLIATTRPLATPLANALVFALVVLATFVGIGALAANRPGNFNVRPDLKPGARLITDGIYRWLRHPMYLAVLLAMGAALAADPRPWRIFAWVALLAVLLIKARREESLLLEKFPEYAAYRAHTHRLLPYLY